MNIQKIVEKIETLKLAKIGNEQIKNILELEESVEDIMKKFEEEQKLRTIDEIVEFFNKDTKSDDWSYYKVFRLIKKGNLPSTMVKGKHKINIDDAEEFIGESKKTREDYKQECADLKAQIKVLEKKIETLEAKQKKTTTRKRTAPKEEETTK
ncbi:hypothetical protein OCD90_28385 [Bacillus pacificus]|uniref:hypothetical protein n=1 Tax=Bacillus TaxID=1386 RepID=UPI0012619AFF|nr:MULTISPECIES: hypothetical protein [Bacillus]KAB7629985.1 hypothetical protein GBN96_28835 [Bacillus sp. B4-WWTP-NA-D-NA-NA]MCC2414369.1 hypothetical protein [Bacillus paranthracis]MCU5259651.1 hypothetical protein [Bacillus pacificus]